MNVKTLWALVKDAASGWSAHDASTLAAALAYYTVFALAPLLVIAIAVAGMVFDRDAAQGQVVTQLGGLVGQQGAETIQAMIRGASKPGEGILGSALGVIMLLVGAGGLFGELQDALNTVWGVAPKPGRGIWGILQDRFLSFTMVLGCAFLLLVSLLASAALAAVTQLLGDWQVGVVGHAVSIVVSFAVITLLFAMIYRFLPDVKIGWGDVWLGAALTALLFTVGKFLIGLYLGHSSIGSTYGAAGSLAVLLVWLYYSSMIFLFGSELTRAYANRLGSHIVPADNAVAVTPEAKAGQKAEATDNGRAALNYSDQPRRYSRRRYSSPSRVLLTRAWCSSHSSRAPAR